MEHALHSVDLLDQQGKIIGQKLRRDIHKTKDVYHTIFVLFVTVNGRLVLSIIPTRDDLPNLYAQLIGATTATIRRSGETSLQAANRSVEQELFVRNAELHFLGDITLDLPNKSRTFASVYYVIADQPSKFSVIDIDTLITLTKQQVKNSMLDQPDTIAPTLRAIWQAYAHRLPLK